MFEKYLVYYGESEFVLKYSHEANEIQLGGKSSAIKDIATFQSEYLGYEMPGNTHSQRGMVRFDFPEVDHTTWREIVEKIENDNIEMTNVKAHGRVI